MVTVATLNADLTANTTRFQQGLAGANRAMSNSQRQWSTALAAGSRSFSKFERDAARTTSTLGALRQQATRLAGITLGGLGAGEAIRASDAFTRLYTSIGNFTTSANQQRQVFNDLYKAAQETGNSVEGLGQTYARLNGALPAAVSQQYDLVEVTNLLSRGFAAAGAEANTINGALLQLSQGLATNFKTAGQELNSFIEGAPVLAKLIAQQLGGQSAADLKRFAAEGKLTSKVFLDALINAKEAINAFQLPDTIEKSMTRLNNAIIKFAGESDTGRAASRNLAAAIGAVADNLEEIVQVGTIAASIYGIQLLGALLRNITASAAFALAQARNAAAMTAAAAAGGRQAAALTALNTAMVGTTATSTIFVGATGQAAAASVAASAAFGRAALTARALGATLLAGVGGPVGLAVIAAVTAITLHTNQAAEAQQRYNEDIDKSQAAFAGYASASEETRKKIIDDANARIQAYLREAIALDKLIEGYAAINDGNLAERTLGALGTAGAEVFGKLGIGKAPSEVLKQRDALTKAIRDMQALLNDPTGSSGGGGDFNAGDSGSAKKDKIEEIIKGLRRETEQLQRQNELYGQKASALDKANKRAEIQNQLADANAKLTTKQREELTSLLETYDAQTEKLEQQEEATKAAKDAEEERKRVLDSLFSNMSTNLEDAIVQGGKLSDVWKGLMEDIIRALIRINVTAPLIQSLQGLSFGGGGSSGGGFLSGIGSFIGSILPSFATGIDYVPHDMTANIHKGERVLTAAENRAFMGSPGMSVQIINNSPAKVSAQKGGDNNGMSLRVMVDQANAANIADPTSQTSRAMNARDAKSITRR